MDVRAIMEHIGVPATPPWIASARAPPEWYEDSAQDASDAGASLIGGPLAQPETEYEYEYDQRVSWSRPADGAAGPAVAVRAKPATIPPSSYRKTAYDTSRQADPGVPNTFPWSERACSEP